MFPNFIGRRLSAPSTASFTWAGERPAVPRLRTFESLSLAPILMVQIEIAGVGVDGVHDILLR